MKQITFIVFFLLFGYLSANAQTAKYVAFKVTGKVMYKSAKGWVQLSPQSAMNPSDSLSLGKGASLQILESKTKQIYKGNRQGKTTTKQFVNDAKQQSRNTLSNLNSAILGRMKSQSGSQNHHMTSVGTSVRGLYDQKLADSICSTIAFFASQVCEGKVVDTSNSIVLRKKVQKETYTLSLKNRTNNLLYVNIVSINVKEKRCRLLLSPDGEQPYVCLGRKSKVKFNEFVFAIDKDEHLMAVAFSRPFDNDIVKLDLESYELPNGENMVDLIVQSER